MMARYLSRRALLFAALLYAIIAPAGLGAACPQDRTYTLDADFDEGTLLNVNHDVPDQLQLSEITETFPFIWIAASARGTIVKINTATGSILGEYWSAPDGRGRNPSRTTVDLNGAVWAGNRDEAEGGLGSAVHVALIETGDCVDRNGNGSIDTSAGLGDIRPWANAGGVDSDGGVDTAEDECIVNYVRVNGTGTRTVAVNALNEAWIGGFNFSDEFDHDLVQANPDGTGTILKSISPGCGGYGGLIDGNGVLWSADISFNRLLRYDPATDVTTCIALGTQSYGLGIDSAGNIWNSTWSNSSIHKIAPDGTILGTFALPSGSYRGVAVTPVDQNVWVANSAGNAVARIQNDGTVVANIPVGATPTGVAVDAAGKVWVANLGSDNAMRIDPAVNAVDLTVSLGSGAGPYNYSDMTGAAVLSTVQQGRWTVVRDGGVDGTEWARVLWNTESCASPHEPEGTILTVEVRAADTEAALGSQAYVAVGNGVSLSGIAGRYIQVKVTFDGASNPFRTPVLCDLSVEATCNTPPDCTDAVLTPGCCWPPNHQFRLVEVTGVSDPDGDPIAITVTSIFQDEPVKETGTGSGNTCPDGVLVDMDGDGIADGAALRCERAGNPKVPGNGRVYHVSFLASDGRGGECTGTVTFCVPHDQRPTATCIDDGALYDSTTCPGNKRRAPLEEVLGPDEVEALAPYPLFIRGDVDWDERVSFLDGVLILQSLFQERSRISCGDSADANDDGQVNVSDPIRLLRHLFLGAGPLPPPWQEVGADPTPDGLGCE